MAVSDWTDSNLFRKGRDPWESSSEQLEFTQTLYQPFCYKHISEADKGEALQKKM